MERSNESLEDQILRILYESATGELTSRDIAQKIKDANLTQVDGVLRKRLVQDELCIDKETRQGTVYILTTEARRRFEPASPRVASPRVEQPTPLYQQRTETQTATAQFQGQYPPPPFLQTQSMPFYPYQSAPPMGSFGYGVPPPPPYYYPPPTQQSSYSYNQPYPMPSSAGPPSHGKKSSLKVRLTKTVDANVQGKTEDAKKKQSRDATTSSQSVNDSGEIWNFLLYETRKIRNQQKTIHEMMSIPFTSGRLSTTPPPRRSFLDRKLSRSPPPSSQNPSPLDSLRTMGPPPGGLQLFPKNNNEELDGNHEEGLESEENSE